MGMEITNITISLHWQRHWNQVITAGAVMAGVDFDAMAAMVME